MVQQTDSQLSGYLPHSVYINCTAIIVAIIIIIIIITIILQILTFLTPFCAHLLRYSSPSMKKMARNNRQSIFSTGHVIRRKEQGQERNTNNMQLIGHGEVMCYLILILI